MILSPENKEIEADIKLFSKHTTITLKKAVLNNKINFKVAIKIVKESYKKICKSK